MSQSDSEKLNSVIAYMKAHWPSQVKPEWQVRPEEYPKIAKKVLEDFTKDATKNHYFIRIAGLSGSGKTTQILPAATKYCEKHHLSPILIAARRFVEYHPHYQEIKDFYKEANLRKMTDEFSTIMLFIVISELIKAGYDIILDVTLLDPSMEEILISMLNDNDYTSMLLMIATSPTVTEHFLGKRAWRHTKETEQEFVRATSQAISYYATHHGDLHIILWSVYDLNPIYDGPIKDSVDIFNDYSSRETLPANDDDARKKAKIDYLVNQTS